LVGCSSRIISYYDSLCYIEKSEEKKRGGVVSVVVFILKAAFIVWFITALIDASGRRLAKTDGFKRRMERKYGDRE